MFVVRIDIARLSGGRVYDCVTYLHNILPHFRDVGEEEEGEDAGNDAEAGHLYATARRGLLSAIPFSQSSNRAPRCMFFLISASWNPP